MPDIELSERAEEILADLWVRREQQKEGPPLAGEDTEAGLRELAAAGLIDEGTGQASLTEEGEREAAGIVRRERLAERLLVDVVNLGETAATEVACKFEHLLRRGIDDEICTLLGHPKVCPHGSPIPPGECCRAGAREAGKIVSALCDLSPGQGGIIAYIHGRQPAMMQRMLVSLVRVNGTGARRSRGISGNIANRRAQQEAGKVVYCALFGNSIRECGVTRKVVSTAAGPTRQRPIQQLRLEVHQAAVPAGGTYLGQ